MIHPSSLVRLKDYYFDFEILSEIFYQQCFLKFTNIQFQGKYLFILYRFIRGISRLNVKEERANSFLVAESVTCTQAIDFSTLVARN